MGEVKWVWEHSLFDYNPKRPDSVKKDNTVAIITKADHDAALRRAKVEGLREALQHSISCLKDLQYKIGQSFVGNLAKEDVETWVDAKALQASRIAKWITARIAELERAAQIEEGE